jgi:hypothetical protein
MTYRGRRPLVFWVALTLALLQLGLGLYGVWWFSGHGYTSGSVSTGPGGRVERTEEHGGVPEWMIASGVVAAGGVIGCAALWVGRRWRAAGMTGIVLGATMGTPLVVTVVGAPVPVLLAAVGTLAVHRSDGGNTAASPSLG